MAEPFCGNCGYRLTGLTESSKCPECGRPLVEVLQRDHALPRGRRYTSPLVIYGLPLVQIAFGPHESERMGRARAIIALGDVAVGWLAIGGRAAGVVALGGSATGLVAFGGVAVGLLALGGVGIGGLALGGGAIGGLALGGGAVGIVAEGGSAVGYYARGGSAIGRYVVIPGRATNLQAKALFDPLHGWIGVAPGSPSVVVCLLVWFAMLATALVLPFAAALVIALVRADRAKRR